MHLGTHLYPQGSGSLPGPSCSYQVKLMENIGSKVLRATRWLKVCPCNFGGTWLGWGTMVTSAIEP